MTTVYCARMPDGAVCPNADECRADRLFVLSKTEDPLRSTAMQRFATLKGPRGSAVLRQAVVNFDAERLLSCRFWRDMFIAVAAVDDNPPRIRDAIREYVRSVRFLGPKAKVVSSAVLGRATTREDLADYLVRAGYLPDDLSAMESIDEVMQVSLDETRAKWGSYELCRFVMWSTFDPRGGRPFESVGGNARKIRGRLGLDRAKKDRPVLTLEYTLSSDATAHLPTVAEAYASEPWIAYFRPLGSEEETQGFGLTQPSEEFENEAGVPEVVHAPVKGASLTSQPKEFF